MVSARYVAFGIAGILFNSVPDRWGRRKSLLVAATVNTLAQLLLITVPIYEVRFFCHILMGLVMLKQSVPFVWSSELMPPKNSAITAVTLTGFDASTLLISCVYYFMVSREWLPLMLGTTIMSAIALVITYICIPESPKWLLA